MAFIAYAHAMFCCCSDFESHYTPSRLACTYDGLREAVARRFFAGAAGFDALNILGRADAPLSREYGFAEEVPGE